MKKLFISLVAVAMLFTGANITAIGIQPVQASVVGSTLRNGSRFNVREAAFARTTPTGANQAVLIPRGATFTRNSAPAVRHNGYTWIQGRASAGITGRDIWVATSQLTRLSGGSTTVCTINAPAYVRNAPNGPNLRNGTRIRSGASFRPIGDATVHHNGWTWRLGAITNDTTWDGFNWSNHTVWVATSQFSTAACR